MERNKNRPRNRQQQQPKIAFEVQADSPLSALDGMSLIQRELGSIVERLDTIQEDIAELKESQKLIEKNLEDRIQRLEVWVDRLKGALLLLSVALTTTLPFLPKLIPVLSKIF